MMDINIYSWGQLRVIMTQSGSTIWATLHHKNNRPSGTGTVAIFLKTPEEIAAWTTLADTLAAMDKKEAS